MIGYDLDGVIAWEGAWLDFWFARKPAWAVAMRDCRLNRCIGWPTEKHALIITGRPIQDEHSTRLWLYHKDIHLPVMHTEYMHALDAMLKADFIKHSTVAKLEACQRFLLTTFVESDADVRATMVEQMRTMGHQTNVVSPREAFVMGLLELRKPRASTTKSSRHENPRSPSNHT